MHGARRILALLALIIGALDGFRPAAADSVVADLSDYAVAITSNFTGTQLLCYGTIETDDPIILSRHDVIVVVRGPAAPITVRRKERVAGIWVNRHAVTFEPMPSYYYVASNRPLLEIASRTVLRRNGIGSEFLDPDPLPDSDLPPDAGPLAIRTYAEAIVRNKAAQSLYMEAPDSVIFRANLFRTPIPIPANAPVGRYKVEVFLVQNGSILNAQSSSFQIDKIGFERTVFRLAYELPYLYGAIVVALAAMMGFGANLIFRAR